MNLNIFLPSPNRANIARISVARMVLLERNRTGKMIEKLSCCSELIRLAFYRQTAAAPISKLPIINAFSIVKL